MTKKKIEQLIDEKVNEKVRAVMQVRAPFEATMQGVTNMLVLIQAAAMNKAQRQEIREQLDGIKWRLVELEKTSRIQPPAPFKHELVFEGCPVEVNVEIPSTKMTLVGPTPKGKNAFYNEFTKRKAKAEEIQFYKRVVQPAMRKAARAKATK